IINQNAFENCNLQGTLDLSKAFVISDYAFAGNQKLEKVITGDTLISIGQYAFAACKKLTDVTITVDTVKYGAYCFTGCESLTSFYVNAPVLPEGMFYECESMTSVKIGPAVNDIEPFAFRDTKIATFEIDSANKAFKVQNADYIISADGTKLVAVSPVVTGEFTATNIGNATVTAIGNGAFSHNTKLTSVVLDKVTSVGEYGLASNKNLTNIKLGTISSMGEYAFFEAGITSLPALADGVEIPNYAFACSGLTSVSIPDGMVLGEGAFSDCLNMKKIVIGNNVTIGDYAFSTDKDKAFDILYYTEGGTRYYYYEFDSALTSLTIGDNAKIGESAFAYAASIKNVTLGANAEIGKMAFYNAVDLENIDLSKAVSIGEYAFSGDVYYICLDDSMSVAAVSKDGQYMYSYHGPSLKSVDLSAATSIGKNAFSYCRDMKSAVLGTGITEVPEYAFAGCIKLQSVNLAGVKTIGDYAFMETDLRNVDASAAETIGDYGFVSNANMTGLKLNANGVDIGEGAFSYCEKLAKVENLQCAKNLGDYSFAYTSITNADLSGAVSIGTHAFMKEKLTPFTVKLGAELKSLGDNPFAMCKVEPFHLVETQSFAGINYNTNVYTYDISDTVKVVDGSLYCLIDTGYELITYAGTDHTNVKVMEDTVRITSMAFAGSDVEIVTLPYTVGAIGHKAFFDCNKLDIMSFASFNAPILEEEFDPNYYNTLEHIPGSGDYGTYKDYDGVEKEIVGMNLIPFYMWNVSASMFSNVFYGANFVDYVGYVEDKMIMIRPVNGQNYDSYVLAQYFDITMDGATAADDITLAAIKAIKAIPSRVSYEDRALVEAARAAYNKIATTEQQALVTNYADLITAEQRIKALTPEVDAPKDNGKEVNNTGLIIALVILVIILVIAVVYYLFRAQIDDAVKAYIADRKDPEKKAIRDAAKAEKKAEAAKKAEEKKAAKAEADAAKKAAKEAEAAKKAEAKAAKEATEASQEGNSNEKEN
ncbi:MAG: leucine-rich repeat domain-containing protein, partial [Lachnospiraceae bacterium]|nr:leucine-rich repeat domain-containing protein [Lachnospiraceae bacterium]